MDNKQKNVCVPINYLSLFILLIALFPLNVWAHASSKKIAEQQAAEYAIESLTTNH